MARKQKSKKTRSKSKTQKKKRDMILSAIENPNISDTDKDMIIDLINHKANEEKWYGQAYTPPGSILDKIVKCFERDSDHPLDLPFFITFLLISGILVRENIKLDIDGNKTEMAIWVNLLCDSGAGKSYCVDNITASLQLAIDNTNKEWKAEDLVWDTGAKSTAQFMREFAGYEKEDKIIEKSRNRTILVIDEATDFFIAMKDQRGHLKDMYQNFLKAYSHKKIEHSTIGGGKLIVDKPVISFLGLATPGRFINQVTEADIEGGFYYRWANKISTEEREMKGHGIYPGTILQGIDEEWKKIVNSIQQTEYVISQEAIEAFKKSFDETVSKEKGILPRAYIRRMSWLHHKLALVYHIVLGKGEDKFVGVEPYLWAERLLKTFADTASTIIREKMDHESKQMLLRVERLIERRQEKGQTTTARDIVMNTKIATKDAELYLKIACKPVKSQAISGKIGGRPANFDER